MLNCRLFNSPKWHVLFRGLETHYFCYHNDWLNKEVWLHIFWFLLQNDSEDNFMRDLSPTLSQGLSAEVTEQKMLGAKSFSSYHALHDIAGYLTTLRPCPRGHRKHRQYTRITPNINTKCCLKTTFKWNKSKGQQMLPWGYWLVTNNHNIPGQLMLV